MKKKTYVITLAKTFMKGHPREGEPTEFKEKYLAGEKIHTLRAGEHWEKVVEEVNAGRAILSVREWSGKPYGSKQIEIDQLTKLGYQPVIFHDFDRIESTIKDPEAKAYLIALATNDGLKLRDFISWFKPNDGNNLRCGVIQFTDFQY